MEEPLLQSSDGGNDSSVKESAVIFPKSDAHRAAIDGDVAKLRSMPTEDFKRRWRGMLPVHAAAANNALPALDFLLSLPGASPDVLDDQGKTPLMHAVAAHSPEACVWLLRHGANGCAKDYDGNMATHWCAKMGFASMMALLANLGLDIEAKDADGKTPLEIAVMDGHIEVIEYLVLTRGSSADAEKAARNAIEAGPLAFWLERCLDKHVGCHESAPGDPIFCGPLVGGRSLPCAARCSSTVPEHVKVVPRICSIVTGVFGVLSSLLFFSLSPASSLQKTVCVVTFVGSIVSLCCFFVATRQSPGNVDTSNPAMGKRYWAALDHAAAVTVADAKINIADAENAACCNKDAWWGETSPVIHQLLVVGPPRSKYCSATRRCVPVFDHYCTFFRMPIGRDNYCMFIITVTVTAASSIIIVGSGIHIMSMGTPAAVQPLVAAVLGYFVSFAFMWAFLFVTHVIQCYWGVTTYELIQAERRYPGYLLDERTGEFKNPYQVCCLRTAGARMCPRQGDVAGSFGELDFVSNGKV